MVSQPIWIGIVIVVFFGELEWKNAIVVFVIAWYIHIIVIVERVDVNYMRIKNESFSII